MTELLAEYTFSDKDSLVCRIEVTNTCTNVYGRVSEDSKRWAPEMRKLIQAVGPTETSHEEEDMTKYHPEGSQCKKTCYKYFHHVHSPHGLKETLNRISKWLPKYD
jgi:hypothetical protein